MVTMDRPPMATIPVRAICQIVLEAVDQDRELEELELAEE